MGLKKSFLPRLLVKRFTGIRYFLFVNPISFDNDWFIDLLKCDVSCYNADLTT